VCRGALSCLLKKKLLWVVPFLVQSWQFSKIYSQIVHRRRWGHRNSLMIAKSVRTEATYHRLLTESWVVRQRRQVSTEIVVCRQEHWLLLMTTAPVRQDGARIPLVVAEVSTRYASVHVYAYWALCWQTTFTVACAQSVKHITTSLRK